MIDHDPQPVLTLRWDIVGPSVRKWISRVKRSTQAGQVVVGRPVGGNPLAGVEVEATEVILACQ